MSTGENRPKRSEQTSLGNNNAIKFIPEKMCFNECITINSINEWQCDLGVDCSGARENVFLHSYALPRLSVRHFLVLYNHMKGLKSRESGPTTLSITSIAVFEVGVVTHRQHIWVDVLSGLMLVNRWWLSRSLSLSFFLIFFLCIKDETQFLVAKNFSFRFERSSIRSVLLITRVNHRVFYSSLIKRHVRL